jgi:hypothetical protein
MPGSGTKYWQPVGKGKESGEVVNAVELDDNSQSPEAQSR